MAAPQVVFRKEVHRQQLVLSIYSPNSEPFNGIVRKLNATYSASKKMWWLPYGKDMVNVAFKAFKDVAWVDYSALQRKEKGENGIPITIGRELGNSAISELANKPLGHTRQPSTENRQHTWTEVQKQAMWAYAEKLRIRRYSESTYRTYGVYFKQFLAAHPNQDPKDITEEQIITHVITTVRQRNYATKTQNQIVNAIKFYYEQVLLLKKKEYWIPRPRKEFKLPVVASEEEIVRLLVAASNLKYQCIIGMLYSTGVRREELVNLRIADVDMDRMQVNIRSGKGKKDRVTLLSQRMAVALTKYLNEYKPHYWLFEGSERSKYSGTSITKLVRDARTAAGIKKKITPHVLRHSFATHLMDNGTDTRYIQELLGHASLETTAIYAHVSTKDFQKIKSPLDRIFEDNKLKNNQLKP
ncbi:MAG: site-specific integrase [Flavobacteriales bacterium]|nr:site-specific integrase [Flavobacteriales bacterium]